MLCRAFSSLPLPFFTTVSLRIYLHPVSFSHLMNRMWRTTAVWVSHLLHPIRRTCSPHEWQTPAYVRVRQPRRSHIWTRRAPYPWSSSIPGCHLRPDVHHNRASTWPLNMATLGWSSLLLLVRHFELISQLCQVLLANLKGINHVARWEVWDSCQRRKVWRLRIWVFLLFMLHRDRSGRR
jgi:hypothetical protein